MCNYYRDRTDHMSLDQIHKFVEQAKVVKVNKLKVLGGEPLMHPQFKEIYDILLSAAKEGSIRCIKIESNKTIQPPVVEASSLVSWKGRVQSKKRHQPILWSPEDLGVVTGPQYHCPQITKCGFSLDKFGYLPCSVAIMIVRLFNLTHLYKTEMPTQAWGLEELCSKCIFSMNHDWRIQHNKGVADLSDNQIVPTKSYAEAIKNYDEKAFYAKVKDF
jgi:hypothetical protein